MNHFTDTLIEASDNLAEAKYQKVAGSSVATAEFNKRCRYCHQYFKLSQIGGHEANCRKSLGIDPGDVPYRLYLKNNSAYIDLDISVKDLAAYRETHPTCEICNRTPVEVTKWDSKFAAKNLCVDHDHVTGKFRGLLCQACNRQLGWYESFKDKAENYLKNHK